MRREDVNKMKLEWKGGKVRDLLIEQWNVNFTCYSNTAFLVIYYLHSDSYGKTIIDKTEL